MSHFPTNIAWIATYQKTFDIGFVYILMVCRLKRQIREEQEHFLAKVPCYNYIMLCGKLTNVSIGQVSFSHTHRAPHDNNTIPHFWLPVLLCDIASDVSL